MIDPQARLLVDATNASPPLDQLGLDQARAWSADRPRAQASPVQRVTDVVPAGDRPRLRVYQPDPSRRLPVIVFVHGGGWTWVARTRPTRPAGQLPSTPGAPSCPWTTGLRPSTRTRPRSKTSATCWTAWGTLVGARLDVSRIALAGESSGAQVALAAAMAWGRHTNPEIKGLLLARPPVDRTLATASWRSYGDEFIAAFADELDVGPVSRGPRPVPRWRARPGGGRPDRGLRRPSCWWPSTTRCATKGSPWRSGCARRVSRSRSSRRPGRFTR